MFWYRIVDWFNDLSERNRIVRNFNKSARDAFILGGPNSFGGKNYQGRFKL